MKVLVLNGPNLARLGTREPDVYGSTTWAQVQDMISQHATGLGMQADIRQTDSEAELIGWLHEAADQRLPVVINPAAFTHYSYGLRDAAAMVTKAGLPLVEVHLSNPHAREEFRHFSYLSPIARGVIAGLGIAGYEYALRYFAQ